MKRSTEPKTAPLLQNQAELDRNSLRITWVISAASALATLFCAYLAFRTDIWQLYALAGVSASLLIASRISSLLIRNGHPGGIWLLIIWGQATFLASSVLFTGLGLISLATILGLAILVAPQTLTQKQVRWAIYVGLSLSVLAGFVDRLKPSFQVVPPLEMRYFLPILLAVVFTILAFFFARNLRNFSLRAQFISTFILVSFLSVGAVTLFSILYLQRMLGDNTNILPNPAATPMAHVADEFITSISLLALAITALAALGGLGMAQILTAPITQLTGIAKRITDGDLNAQAPVDSKHELGTLADAFNTMTSELRLTMAGLEQRVAERTGQLERRALQLRASAEVGSAIASIRVLDDLLPKITHLISQRFGFYHVGIFLLDPTGEFAELRAANSEGGERMLARHHKLKVGEVGIVGFVTGKKEPRIALDIGQDAVFFNNPDLPETRSEMALPLVAGDHVLGALDVQSTEPDAFTQEDITTLQLLADQVAIAIDNARLFSENQIALEAIRRAYGELSREAWAKLLHERTDFGVIANKYDILYSPADNWPDEMIRAAETSTTIYDSDGTVAIPIKERDHVLGILRLCKPDSELWSKEELSLAETLAQQLYLALENARLYQETQRRAERERLASDITAKMRLSNDPQVILQTAVQELQRALNIHSSQDVSQPARQPVESTPDNGGNPSKLAK